MNQLCPDFEKPLLELEEKIAEMRKYAETEGIDLSEELEKLEQKTEKLREKTYSKLTPWQRVQLARHPQRPYTLDYIGLITTDFVELHGDRGFADDSAVVAGLARLGGKPVAIVGHQKGRTTKEKLYRNFGMPHPEGYRKALRIMQLAAKFKRPVICLVDTPGAHPGLEAEERGQAEAIARNLYEMSHLPVPIIVVVIGEGASGGALGIGVGDRLLMLENTWYSVISPEGCAAILWRTKEKKEEAAETLKLTAQDIMELGLIDEIIPEPFGGAHRDWEKAAQLLKSHILKHLSELRQISTDQLVQERIEKFNRMGVWKE